MVYEIKRCDLFVAKKGAVLIKTMGAWLKGPQRSHFDWEIFFNHNALFRV